MSPTLTRFRPLSRANARLRGGTLDRRIAAGADPTQDPLLSERAEQLTSNHTRRELASWIEGVIEEAENRDPLRRSAVPLQRMAICESREQLLSLARDLAAVHEPVSARGVARVRQLLTDGESPLYGCPGLVCSANGAELDQAVRHARASLSLE